MLFALGVLGLTLPSIVSQNYRRLGLAEPPLTSAFMNKSMLLRVGVTDKLEDMRIISPAYTAVSHMFLHKDLSHWASNMLSLFTITASDPPTLQQVLRTAFTFFGGGLGGVLGHMIYATITKRRQEEVNPGIHNQIDAAQDTITRGLNWGISVLTGDPAAGNLSLPRVSALSLFRERTYYMCGCSAGVYALVGAEFVRLAIQLYVELKTLARLRGFGGNSASSERRRIQENIRGILTQIVAHAMNFVWQIAAASGWLMGYDGSSSRPGSGGSGVVDTPGGNILATTDQSVGYAAHVCGFVFGVGVQLAFPIKSTK
ncbi:hypothetical protein HDU83_002219 [Entophlyctis luteolus]|nr:hypothetical protein HDU82_003262 [Entophlyctis luteolus]KAJ3355934.1 hypothetical protein HDU83_002219 [Entophlyctis luteolus]KAJ3388563.1 hypothetical protein HDU84_009661 [Entophlyctis sp. JEL0112]